MVQELVQLRGEIQSLETQEQKLTEKLKKEMKKKRLEEFGPTDSPWKLVRTEYDKSSVSWKDQWVKLAKKLKMKYKKEMEKLQNRYRTDVVSLTIEPNESYKGGK
jgi:hypothetical protein